MRREDETRVEALASHGHASQDRCSFTALSHHRKTERRFTGTPETVGTMNSDSFNFIIFGPFTGEHPSRTSRSHPIVEPPHPHDPDIITNPGITSPPSAPEPFPRRTSIKTYFEISSRTFTPLITKDI